MGLLDIFKKKKPVKAVAAPASEPALKKPILTPPPGTPEAEGIIKGVIDTKDGSQQVSGDEFMNIVPEVDESLLDNVVAPKSIALTILRICFVSLMVVGGMAVAFFQYHLDNKFTFLKDDKPVERLYNKVVDMNENLLDKQTDVNTYRYLQIKGYLDHFTFNGDQYLHNYKIYTSSTSTDRERNNASRLMTLMRENLRAYFLELRDLYRHDITKPILNGVMVMSDADIMETFKESLTVSLRQYDAGVAGSREVSHLVRLVENNSLKNLIIKTDFDALNDLELMSFLNEVNDTVTNSLSTMQKIKEERIRLSDIIKEIELRTISVDNFYSSGEFDKYGGVRWTSYDFDSVGRKISIVGETKILDTKLFSFIADLVISLNSSPLFKDGEIRSFSKSGDLSTGYSSSVRLVLSLEEDEEEGEEALIDNTN
ncbi:hypothetical protein CVV38_01865 [Candidatus Peregrinibacteria bacterium HGW-Peregrinibacteria-1]|jgi:hypothetical protein|nr:MAG: hypothetical protein CVV38_01865 [Candidatus Peregrinibacteria bacterium HGW-Peregrinibacteria-1]